MTAMSIYIWFPGSTREALTFYQGVFGGELAMHTLAEMGRDDGPADAIGHGMLVGPVTLYATDAVGDDEPVRMTGLSVALLGTAEPATLSRWFASLSEGGTVLDALQERPWGASDGQVVDRFGIRWLIGFEHAG
ncbi:VOC family protein [Agrococcus baldri]|uniref:VOC family protein n=1 Tax=Agrococcus baldri TaxID=153730 RepID=A0AA87RBY4_9MICO|nr:VOC family protein [Agrococcus baldri]GEK80254.1 VOC family protein [Agrococcus baldri]